MALGWDPPSIRGTRGAQGARGPEAWGARGRRPGEGRKGLGGLEGGLGPMHYELHLQYADHMQKKFEMTRRRQS